MILSRRHGLEKENGHDVKQLGPSGVNNRIALLKVETPSKS